MFEDVEHIEAMTPEEYDRVLYYLKHPDKYGGDYAAFRDKLIEFASLPDHNKRIFAAQYQKAIQMKRRKKGLTH